MTEQITEGRTQPQPQPEPRPEQERALSGLRVLVVDDNATNRTVLEGYLACWGVDCECATGAKDALGLLTAAVEAGASYELALIDLAMPGVDGCQLVRAIRSRPDLHQMRLILQTSSVRPDGAELMDGFLAKPVRQSRLYEEIQAVMAGRPPEFAALPTPAVRADPRPAATAPVVLVVEDTQVNQFVASRMLEKSGLRVEVAADGREALAALSRTTFAAVLMDCQMPTLDGYQTTQEIRRREGSDKHTPIIAMIASSMEGDRERCLAAGMDDYLSKPLRAPALEEALRRWTREDGVLEPEAEEGLLDLETVGALRAELEGTDAFHELLGIFLSATPVRLATLRGAIERDAASEAADEAHAIKGSAASMGAKAIAELARELEAAGRGGDLGQAEDLVGELDRAFDRTREVFGREGALTVG